MCEESAVEELTGEESVVTSFFFADLVAPGKNNPSFFYCLASDLARYPRGGGHLHAHNLEIQTLLVRY